MANKLYEENSISAMASAIRNKNGSSNTYNVSQMASAITNIPTSTSVVNGILASYKAVESTISADTFVEFVNSLNGNDTQLSSATDSYQYATAVRTQPSTVVVLYRNGSYLYGVACQIQASARTISLGTPTQLSTVADSYQYVSGVKSGIDGLFMVVHRNGNYLYALPCSVSGQAITIGTDTQLSTVNNSYQDASGVFICASLVSTKYYVRSFIAHRAGGTFSSRLYGLVCKWDTSNNSITVGTDTQLSSGLLSYNNAYAARISNTAAVVVHNSGTTFYGVVCSMSSDIQNLTVTPGTDTQLCSQTLSYEYCRAVLVDTDKLLITHRYDHFLYGMVCTVSGTTITPGTDTLLSSGESSSDNASAVAFATNKVFIAHRNGDYLYGLICSVSGTTVTVVADIQLTNVSDSYDYACAVLADQNTIFVSHARDGKLYGIIVVPYEETRVIACGVGHTSIDGVTKTSCSTSIAGNVWVLNNGAN